MEAPLRFGQESALGRMNPIFAEVLTLAALGADSVDDQGTSARDSR